MSMFPFSISEKIDFQNSCKTLYTSVGSGGNYGGGGPPSSSGLCYSQGYMNGSSTTSGMNSLKSGEFGSVIGSMGYCHSTGNMNSYNNGWMNGTRDR
jgi:hypothetical protein